MLATAGLVAIAAIAVVAMDMRLAGALSLGALAALFFYRHPFLLLSLFPLLSIVEVFLPNAALLRAGGIKFLPMDPVYFLSITQLGLYALTCPREILRVLKENKFLTLFLFLVVVSVAVYTPIYGQSALGEARKFYFMFFFPLLAAVTIKDSSDLKRFIMVVIASAVLVALVAIVKAGMSFSIVRVLNSEATLIMALGAFSLLLFRFNKVILVNPTVDAGLLGLFAFFVLGSAQRSVWLAVGIGMMILAWLYRRKSAYFVRLVVITVMLVIGGSTAVLTFPEAGSKIVNKFYGIIDPYSDDTASWRIKGWEEQIKKIREVGPVLGEGLGGYYSWMKGSYEVNASPHNAYLQIVLKFGLVGLAIYLLLAAQFFRKMLEIRKSLAPGPLRACLEMGVVNFGAAHGFMLGYGFEPMILAFFGVAVGTARLIAGSPKTSKVSETSARTMADSPYSRAAKSRAKEEFGPIISARRS